MEIKRGISQMAEYPNVEINYVVPKNGNMHYVLKEGILDNGVIIATLDPRHAIDEVNPCQNIGVFSATGDVLVDFNKKDIRKITDNLLLVVNAVPTTNLVATPDDAEAAANKDLIVQMMMQEMGPTGEIIFEDPYSEANVYATDSYNNKVGIDCSFIGKNNEGLYFHTNDVNSLSKFIKVDEFSTDSESTTENEFSNVSLDNIPEEPVANTDDVEEEEDLQLNINPTILGGFNIPQEESTENEVEESTEPTEVQLTEDNTEISNISSDIEEPETTEDESTGVEETNSSEEVEESKEVGSEEEETDDEVKEDTPSEDKEESTEEENSEEESDTETEEDTPSEEQEEPTEEENSEEDSDTEIEEDTSSEDKEEETVEENNEDNEYTEDEEEEEDDGYMEKSRRNTRRKSVLDNDNNDVEILDEAIDIINKMMEETDKLNKRIKKLEARLDEKEQVIQEQTELIEEQDNKKSELNNILNKASRLLENIE